MLGFAGARRVNGPSRVAVEKDREVGEREEKGRVSGEAYRRRPLGMADSIDEVLIVVCSDEGIE